MTLETILLQILYAVIVFGVLMTMCAYAVLAERKISSWIQGRVGPNRTSMPALHYIPVVGRLIRRAGLVQPVADGLKFLFKEDPTPGHVRKNYYYLAPLMAIVPALSTVAVVPFGQYVDAGGLIKPLILAPLDTGLLFIFAISSLSVYGIVLGGWAANSKYPLMGGVRASAQMISYELAMGLSVLPVVMWINGPGMPGGLSLVSIVQAQERLWFALWQPLSAGLFLVALFAETNRLPFDMAESETDLVGGFHTEYGAFKFGLFFVAEYAHIIVGSAVFICLFLGGWHFLPGIADPWPVGWPGAVLSVLWFLVKVSLMVFFFIWVRWTLPRFRYDQVMDLGWCVLLPLAIGNFIIYALLIAFVDKI